MAAPRDPFYLVRDEVTETLATVTGKLNRWLALPRAGQERKSLQQGLDEDVHSLQYMVSEIDKSIDAAESNPARFGLTQAELSDRRRWVLSTRRQVDGIIGGMAAAKESAAAAPAAARGAAGKLEAAAHEENERFIGSEGNRQQLIMRQQDESLEDLSSHVVRIGELGKEMGQELHVQGQLLDELDVEIEGTSTRLSAAQKKVQHVIDKAGFKGQLAIIGVLILLLVVLIFLAVA